MASKRMHESAATPPDMEDREAEAPSPTEEVGRTGDPARLPRHPESRETDLVTRTVI